jgi:hypothetical protein
MCVRICSLWVGIFVFTSMAFGLTPPPPVTIPYYLGTSGCPASPTIVRDVYQDRAVLITVGACAVGPGVGTLVFSSSDANATLPATFNYNFLVNWLVPNNPDPVTFRTPGRQTLTARDAANNVVLTETVNVLPSPGELLVNCITVLNVNPPTITLTGRAHPLAVINCSDVATAPLTFVSSDACAQLPSGARSYLPSPGVPVPAGEVIFCTPGLQTVSLQNASGTIVAEYRFNAIRGADEASGGTPIPSLSTLGIGICGLVLAGLALTAQRRRKRAKS